MGHDGRTGDDIVESTDEHTDREGSHTTTIVTRHDDGSTTTVESWVGVRGSTTYSSTDKDVKGNVTGGSTEVHQTNGESTKMQYQRNPDTGEMNYHRITTSPDGTSRHYIGTTRRTAPSETPYSGRGGIDEAWMDKSLPWFMDTVYLNWKRENDLVQSGGRIAQPGRGDDSSPVGSEGPSAGASAVTNCGDSGTNPCARFGGSEVDVHGRLGGLSQPPLGDPRGGPSGMGVPAPLPIPPPKQ